MNEYCVSYEGNIYSNVGYYWLGAKYPEDKVIKVNTIPCIIDQISKFEKTDTNFVFSLGHVIFNIVDGKAVFDEIFEEDDKIVFDIVSSRASGLKFNKNLVSCVFNSYGFVRANLLKFLSCIINTNENVKKYIENIPSFMRVGNIKNDKNLILLTNLYNLITFNLLEFEKIINSNNEKFLKENLDKESFEITEANKLHQVVGLPKFAVQSIKELKMEEYIENIKELATLVDGNSLNIILQFLGNSKLVFDAEYEKKYRYEKMTAFFRYLCNICKRKTYKITDLLNYLLRQSFYYNSQGCFRFPLDEIMYLSDYLDMCDKYKLSVEKYPSQLRKMHDIVSKNVVSLEVNSDIVNEQFKKAVDDYKDIEMTVDISIKDENGLTSVRTYAFIVPRTIKDIIEEGNVLHHCVGSYGSKIINKEARIVFMRDKNNLKTPLVTIDIDKNYFLVEAKKAFNEDVDVIQRKVIDKWLKKIESSVF